ncbi:MAG: SdrD B-like domain-containing protein [Ardenticatenaceae bacterium]
MNINWKKPARFMALAVSLLGILFSTVLFINSTSGAQAASPEETSISHYQSFAGQYDYVVIGSTESPVEVPSSYCPENNDSSANLYLPDESNVVAAYLYWSGSGDLDSSVTLNGSEVWAEREFSEHLQDFYWNQTFYGAFADVTNLVNSDGTYTVSDLSWIEGGQYCQGGSAYGGWSLVVVYEDEGAPVNHINIYDGFIGYWPAGTVTNYLDDVTVDACDPNFELTHVSWEGDNYKGEHFYINGSYKGGNTYNGSTSPNLDIDTYTMGATVGTNSIDVSTTSYLQNTSYGNAIEWFINNVYVVKTRECDLASIGDTVFEDLNANGIQNAGEPGVSGVTVELLDSNNQVVDTTTTNNNGIYAFTDLVPGDYSLRFIAPAGYMISPQDQGSDATDSDADPTSGQTIVTTLSSGENDSTWDAGLFQKASLGDTVFEDLNADGIQDAGEPGISDVTVELLDGSNQVLDTTTTDNNGMYSFTELMPGDYALRFTVPADYMISPQDQGANDATDSDADPTDGETIVTTLISGENDLTWDAGLFRKASLGDKVWEDSNSNGIQDPNEPMISGVTVELFDSNGNLVDSTTTDGDGMYNFSDLMPACYEVQFTAPTDYMGTLQDQGSDDTLDSDADPNTGRTDEVCLESNEDNTTVDAGFIAPPPTASIGNKVFEDLDADGIQDAGEPGVPDVTVELLDSSNQVLDSTTTNSNGMYNFTDLVAGDYALRFTAPTGYMISPQDQGADDATDSDADPTNGETIVTTLSAGENDSTWDAGLFRKASLGDKVWEDSNGDGIQDADEPGLADLTVELFDSNGDLVDSTTTDSDGMYNFSDLMPACYEVQFSGPSGYTSSPQDEGSDDTLDSDADPNSGRTDEICLESNEDNTTVDAGFVPPSEPASLGNKVWEDLDEDGILDSGEPGVANVTVNLWTDDDNDGNPDTQIATDTTNNTGFYRFNDLDPALTYIVEFVLPDGREFTVQDQGSNDGRDSDADPTTGFTAPINLVAGEYDSSIDAGLLPEDTPPTNDLSLGDTVWLDENNNGVQDSGEAGIEGVSLRLYPDNNDNGSPDSSSIATTVTDQNGNYLFTGLQPGKYLVEVGTTNFNSGRPLQALTSSTGGDSEPAPDPDDNVDNDDNGTEGITGTGKRVVRSGTIMLSAGDEPTDDGDDADSNLTLDFGFAPVDTSASASIRVEKSTNGVDADQPTGPAIPIGNPVTWEYIVSNNGDFDLVNVVVDDDQLGQVCTIASLPVGASATCTKHGTAEAGLYANIATATGDPVDENGDPATNPDGTPVDSPSDTDASHYVGISISGCIEGTMIEAEDGDLIGPRFAIGDDPAASGGQYIHVPNGLGNSYSFHTKDRAEYCFTVSEAGTYRIKGLVYAETGADNSFFVQVDGQPASGYLWEFGKNTNYDEDFVSDRNGADPVEVELTPGDHLISIMLREDGARLDKIFLELVEGDGGGGGGDPTCGPLLQEAEDGSLMGNFVVGDDAAASGGQYVHVPNGQGNSYTLNSQQRVDYCFVIDEPGVYNIKGFVYAASGQDNSFFAQVNGSPMNGYVWDFPKNTDYLSDLVSDRNGADPVLVVLDAGEHTVSIFLREDGARLDKLELQKVYDTAAVIATAPYESGGLFGVMLMEEGDNRPTNNDNHPFADINLMLVDSASQGQNYQMTVSPDAQGRFALEPVPTGDYIFKVEAPTGYTILPNTEMLISIRPDSMDQLSFEVRTENVTEDYQLFLPAVISQ